MIERVKGDTLTLLIKAKEPITGWKFRAELKDCSGHSIKLATENSGGSDDQIIITDGANGRFSVYFPAGATTDFADTAELEIEAETDQLVGGEPEIITILQEQVVFDKQEIKWTEPS